MKYALYYTTTGQVVQWQDDEVYGYNEPEGNFARIELNDPLPVDFDVNAQPSGYWVIDGVLTQTAPPAPLSDVAMRAGWAVTAKRADLLAEGVALAGGRRFRPTDADLARLAPIALNHAALGIAAVDVLLDQPPVWYGIAAVDLAVAYSAFIVKREACYSNERLHLEAIAALLAAEDRAGLEEYDATTGWPT
ncbi:hypothetical protein FHT32_001283 [Variovorax sp. SG517]|uniref:hypothetical protein n=1 Tax=Variovorax sp. SG517 TaxID=2587117 RepID=UPI00159D971F|nr:hypothetical protein [Variovorax sp. SG517]NVM87644.1 hypothetical protein [Variovorax sp. SG517]